MEDSENEDQTEPESRLLGKSGAATPAKKIAGYTIKTHTNMHACVSECMYMCVCMPTYV